MDTVLCTCCDSVFSCLAQMPLLNQRARVGGSTRGCELCKYAHSETVNLGESEIVNHGRLLCRSILFTFI